MAPEEETATAVNSELSHHPQQGWVANLIGFRDLLDALADL
jgi:hypothetical protein